MSGLRRNTKRTFTKKDKRSFYLVASDVFFGLVFSREESYDYKINRSLTTTPSFLFYENQSKVVIDYSNSKNESDLSFVSSFFNSLEPGITFTIESATYNEPSTGVKANISGVYSFTSFDKGKIVRADLVSAINISPKKDLYNGLYFTATPQLAKASGVVSTTQQRKNIVKNTLSIGQFSFRKMGVRVGDYVEFSGIQTNENVKMKVINYFIDTEGVEGIEVDTDLISENLIGSPIMMNIYFEGEPTTEVNIEDKTYGSCLVISPIGVVSCTQCQNEFMCTERARKRNSTSSYIPFFDCNQEEIVQRTTEIREQVLSGISQAQQIIPTQTTEELFFVSNKPKAQFKIVEIKERNGSLTEKEITVSPSTTLKVLLSDPSLKDYSFLFSRTNPAEKTTALTDVIRVGKPGFTSSYISISAGSVPNTFYLASSNAKLILKINVK